MSEGNLSSWDLLCLQSVHMENKAKQSTHLFNLPTVPTVNNSSNALLFRELIPPLDCCQEPCAAHGHVAVRGEHGGERRGDVSHRRPPHSHHQVGVVMQYCMITTVYK